MTQRYRAAGTIFTTLSTVLLTLSACNRTPNRAQPAWTDLTHPFDSNTLYWPNNTTGFVHHADAMGVTDKGYYYSSYSVCAPEHGGTHLDAPIHFAQGKQSVDEIPIDNLTGDAVIIDVSDKALKNRDYQILPEDIRVWESQNGEIPARSIVLFRTGYGTYYPDREKYFGTALRGSEAIPNLHFPGIHPEAARLLVQMNVKAVGLDTPSLDYGQSTDFQTHRILLAENIPGFENLANLDKLPAKGLYVIALPMKIGKGSGAPLRIIAGTGFTY